MGKNFIRASNFHFHSGNGEQGGVRRQRAPGLAHRSGRQRPRGHAVRSAPEADCGLHAPTTRALPPGYRRRVLLLGAAGRSAVRDTIAIVAASRLRKRIRVSQDSSSVEFPPSPRAPAASSHSPSRPPDSAPLAILQLCHHFWPHTSVTQ